MLRKLFVLLSVITLMSCGTSRDHQQHELTGYDEKNVTIGADVEDDQDIADYIHPYVREMQKEMGRVITKAEASLERGQPEGALGNLIADLTRSRASSELRTNVDIAVINNGGLRIPLPPGDITVGMVYELMPFDNIIAVLTMSGEQVMQMADELAACGGEPISGMRMRIRNGNATDVLVGSSEVNPERTYLVATNNWMADGGGCVPSLWNPLERNDLPLLIREAIMDHFGSRETISPRIDNRIRG